jgi:hypothetical protein
LGGSSNIPRAVRHISSKAFHQIWGVSRAWQRQSIKWGDLAPTWRS